MMNDKKLSLDGEGRALCKRAQDTYGHEAELFVAIEELTELLGVLSKIPRFRTLDEARAALHDKALDEYVDVMIVMEHVRAGMGLNDEEIADKMDFKLGRLEKWLNKGSDIAISLEIRE